MTTATTSPWWQKDDSPKIPWDSCANDAAVPSDFSPITAVQRKGPSTWLRFAEFFRKNYSRLESGQFPSPTLWALGVMTSKLLQSPGESENAVVTNCAWKDSLCTIRSCFESWRERDMKRLLRRQFCFKWPFTRASYDNDFFKSLQQ